MGMSASQGRLLMLTARKNDLEMRNQNVAQRRLILSSKLEDASYAYQSATNNRHLYFSLKEPNAKPSRLTYANITSQIEDGGLGYRLVDIGNNIVLNKEDPKKTQGVVIDPKVDDPDKLENYLQNGKYFIQTPLLNGDNVEWHNKSIEQIGAIWNEKDPTDDAGAEARFASVKQQIATQDKLLELEQKGIETEHKAVATEFESVQKLIMSNVEKSYKMFNA